MKKLDYTVGVFVAVIVLCAFSAAAYHVDGGVEAWRRWAIMLSLESLRAVMVISNVHIKQHSARLGWAVLILSICVTIGFGIMYSKAHELDSFEFWMLQVSNVLLLTSEFSVSSLLEAREKQKLSFDDFLNYVDHNRPWEGPELPDPLKRLLVYAHDLKRLADEKIAQEAALRNEFSDAVSTLDAKFEQCTTEKERYVAKAQERDRMLTQVSQALEFISDKERLKGGIGRLNNLQEELGDEAICELISRVGRLAYIGNLASDTRISIGANEYQVLCSGRDSHGAPEACRPFTMNKASQKMNCPTCGKEHTRETLTHKLAKNG